MLKKRFLLFLPLFIFSTAWASADDIWARLDDGVQSPLALENERLSHSQLSSAQERVAREKRWLRKNGLHLSTLAKRASVYIEYVIDQCEEQGVPLDIALLPMVESVYDPFALSQDGAAGLWQLMPSTGIQLGVTINWWYDGRRDVVESTDAAIRYLKQLHRRFDDWALALAAYNAGPARVGRAVKSNIAQGGTGSYWEIKLPRETARYVPRLLALRDMFVLEGAGESTSAENRAFEVITLSQQVALPVVAQEAELDLAQLYKLNAGLNRWATPPEGPHKIFVPRKGFAKTKAALDTLQKRDSVKWRRYVVESGDTLSGIASDHRSRTEWIAEANQLKGNAIREHQTLLVPWLKKGEVVDNNKLVESIKRMGETVTGKRRIQYVVKRGDSWWEIAKKFDVDVDTLAGWNKSSPDKILRMGATLTVWQNVNGLQRSDVFRTIYHTVRSGDTLSALAHRHKVSVGRIVSWNRLHNQKYIQPGDVLTLHVNVTR